MARQWRNGCDFAGQRDFPHATGAVAVGSQGVLGPAIGHASPYDSSPNGRRAVGCVQQRMGTMLVSCGAFISGTRHWLSGRCLSCARGFCWPRVAAETAETAEAAETAETAETAEHRRPIAVNRLAPVCQGRPSRTASFVDRTFPGHASGRVPRSTAPSTRFPRRALRSAQAPHAANASRHSATNTSGEIRRCHHSVEPPARTWCRSGPATWRTRASRLALSPPIASWSAARPATATVASRLPVAAAPPTLLPIAPRLQRPSKPSTAAFAPRDSTPAIVAPAIPTA
jgi:hypothetical protein